MIYEAFEIWIGEKFYIDSFISYFKPILQQLWVSGVNRRGVNHW
jgi:hypothetical protein